MGECSLFLLTFTFSCKLSCFIITFSSILLFLLFLCLCLCIPLFISLTLLFLQRLSSLTLICFLLSYILSPSFFSISSLFLSHPFLYPRLKFLFLSRFISSFSHSCLFLSLSVYPNILLYLSSYLCVLVFFHCCHLGLNLPFS